MVERRLLEQGRIFADEFEGIEGYGAVLGELVAESGKTRVTRAKFCKGCQ
jgi:hypothetical protein